MVVMLQNHQLLAPLTHADQQPSLSALNPHEISPLRGWVRGRTPSAGEEGGKLEAGHCVRVEELWFIEVGGAQRGHSLSPESCLFLCQSPQNPYICGTTPGFLWGPATLQSCRKSAQAHDLHQHRWQQSKVKPHTWLSSGFLESPAPTLHTAPYLPAVINSQLPRFHPKIPPVPYPRLDLAPISATGMRFPARFPGCGLHGCSLISQPRFKRS